MNPRSGFTLSVCAVALLLGAGCAKKNTLGPVDVPAVAPRSAATQALPPKYTGSAVSVSGEIMDACNITFENVDRAPKFDFDKSALLPQDRNVLDQVAKCVTTGPLKGRTLKLIGRADPRGEVEYNFVLGEHRAGSVESYLAQLGVGQSKMAETSRGKLDANGTDEAGWQRDRRVDLVLR
jgi:peptidoglycan-associated lipoprotein